MKHIKIFITVALMLSANFMGKAQTGIMFINDGIKYHILSNEDMTVEVYHCDYLGEDGRVTIPATITNDGVEYTVIQIGGWSFSGRTDLKSIDLPSTITSIGTSAFYACSFSEINLPSSLKNIYAGAFAECDSLREVIFPEGLISIGGLGFGDCQNLEHIEIPSTVTYIGGGAFRFSAIKSVDIPGSVKEVNGFGGCGHLTAVTLHEGTTSIGDGAFNTGSLKEIRLPSTINYIGMMAFNELDDIYIPCPNPPKVYYNGWYYGRIKHIHVPKGTYNHYKARPYNEEWENLVEDETLGVYCDIVRNITGAGSVELDSTVVMTNADGFHFVPGGTDLTFTLRPEPKYMIKHVSLNETDITHQLGYGVTLFEDAPNLDLSDKLTEKVAYTISNMQEAVAINVDYAKNPYSKLSMRQGVGGTLSVRMHCDEPVLMTIVADDDNVFDGVTMNGEPALINDKNIVAVPNLDDPVTIQVNYQKSGE